jgi:hypothetical protein
MAVVKVFDVLIFSGALFHTLAASHIKLVFALVDLPTSVRSPRVTLLVSIAFSCLSLVFISIIRTFNLVPKVASSFLALDQKLLLIILACDQIFGTRSIALLAIVIELKAI